MGRGVLFNKKYLISNIGYQDSNQDSFTNGSNQWKSLPRLGKIQFCGFFFNFDSLVKSRTVINKTGITLVLLKNNVHSEFNSTSNCLKCPTRVWEHPVFAQMPILANPDISLLPLKLLGFSQFYFWGTKQQFPLKTLIVFHFKQSASITAQWWKRCLREWRHYQWASEEPINESMPVRVQALVERSSLRQSSPRGKGIIIAVFIGLDLDIDTSEELSHAHVHTYLISMNILNLACDLHPNSLSK